MAVGARPSAPIVANIVPAPPATPTAARKSRLEISRMNRGWHNSAVADGRSRMLPLR
jgi:hypothetical protein